MRAETKELRAAVVAVVLLVAGATIAQAAPGNLDGRHKVTIVVNRTCAEDEPWLRGRGSFNGVTWSRYECVHVEEIGG